MSVYSSVRAGQTIPAFSISLPFNVKIDLKKVFVTSNKQSNSIEIYCTQDGLLYIEQQIPTCETHWASLIEIAKNCSEHNVTLNKIIGTNQYQLRTNRTLEINESLKLWPNLSLLNEWNIPYFLEPSSIINKDYYKCTQCYTVYQEPNQLKIHLAFLCKTNLNNSNLDNCKLTKNLFLNSLNTATLNLNLHTNFHSSFPACFFHPNTSKPIEALNLDVSTSLKNSLISNTTNNENDCGNNLKINNKRKLDKKQDLINALNKLNNDNTSSSKANLEHHLVLNLMESDLSSSDTLDEIMSEKEISSSINVITNASSHKHKTLKITKEPRSHTCVFCGKLYTRKYGLKIHIRTHTGHKPLKCMHCARAFSDPSNLNKHMRLHQQHRQWNKHVNLKT